MSSNADLIFAIIILGSFVIFLLFVTIIVYPNKIDKLKKRNKALEKELKRVKRESYSPVSVASLIILMTSVMRSSSKRERIDM